MGWQAALGCSHLTGVLSDPSHPHPTHQVELGPIRKAAEGTPTGRRAPAATAAGQSPLTPGAAAAAARVAKLGGTPQSGTKPRSALGVAN